MATPIKIIVSLDVEDCAPERAAAIAKQAIENAVQRAVDNGFDHDDDDAYIEFLGVEIQK